VRRSPWTAQPINHETLDGSKPHVNGHLRRRCCSHRALRACYVRPSHRKIHIEKQRRIFSRGEGCIWLTRLILVKAGNWYPRSGRPGSNRTRHPIQQSLWRTQPQLERILCGGPAPPLSSKNVERINNKDDIWHSVMFLAAIPVIPILLKSRRSHPFKSVVTNNILRRK